MLEEAEELLDPPYLQVRQSRLHGQGLFTTRPFRAGQRICIIAGEVIDHAEAVRREREEGNYYIFYLDDNRYLDATDGIGRWLNHSCAPSALVVGRDGRTLWLVALRDLEAGEEIVIDYDDGQIYDLCRRMNPACRGEECPKALSSTSPQRLA